MYEFCLFLLYIVKHLLYLVTYEGLAERKIDEVYKFTLLRLFNTLFNLSARISNHKQKHCAFLIIIFNFEVIIE